MAFQTIVAEIAAADAKLTQLSNDVPSGVETTHDTGVSDTKQRQQQQQQQADESVPRIPWVYVIHSGPFIASVDQHAAAVRKQVSICC